MGKLYRVFPYVEAAAPNEPGGAIYIPPQGAGRIDNPELYSVLYLSDEAAGAVAEGFGRFPEWSPAILAGSAGLPGSTRALARCRLDDDAEMCNLDDPEQLLALSLRPSDIVSREYSRTRAWARRIHSQGRWRGLRWWSYYDPRWASIALWDLAGLELESVHTLRLDAPAVVHASAVIARRIVSRTRR